MEERKGLSLDLAVTKADQAKGIIEGIANTSTRDVQGDEMRYGCWKSVIDSGRLPSFCWGHNVADIRGKVTALAELAPGDPRIPQNQKGPSKASGLWFQAQMAPTQDGRDAYELLSGGYIKEISVQFAVGRDGEESDGKGGRVIKEVAELFEISAVLKGASVGTRVLVAKDDEPPKKKVDLPLDQLSDQPAKPYVPAYWAIRAYGLGFLKGLEFNKEDSHA